MENCSCKSKIVIALLSAILIVLVVGVGFYFYQIKTKESGVAPKLTEEEIKIIAAQLSKAIKVPNESKPVEKEAPKASTLKIVEDHLEGEVEATGFLMMRKEEVFEENFDRAYLAITSAGDKILTSWIAKMVKSGNTVNRLGTYPMLGLGCDTGTKIDGTWTQISGDAYKKLKGSSVKNLVKLQLIFADPPDIGGPCLTYLKEVK